MISYQRNFLRNFTEASNSKKQTSSLAATKTGTSITFAIILLLTTINIPASILAKYY